MSTYGPRSPRSNKEVARNMLISGSVILGLAVLSQFADNWVATQINSGSGFVRDAIYRAWNLILGIGIPLGSALVVGAIIVNRLPERSPE